MVSIRIMDRVTNQKRNICLKSRDLLTILVTGKKTLPQPLSIGGININIFFDPYSIPLHGSLKFIKILASQQDIVKDSKEQERSLAYLRSEFSKYPISMLKLFPSKTLCLKGIGMVFDDIKDTAFIFPKYGNPHHELFHFFEIMGYQAAPLPLKWLSFAKDCLGILNAFSIPPKIKTVPLAAKKSEIMISPYRDHRRKNPWFFEFKKRWRYNALRTRPQNKLWTDFDSRLQTNKTSGFVSEYSKSNPYEDKATIAEMLFNTKKQLVIEKLKLDDKLKRKVEFLTGCNYDPDSGLFTHLLSPQEMLSRFGTSEHYWYAKWSNENGIVQMDHAFWNKTISENTGDLPHDRDHSYDIL
jgi:hypothetical protein